MTDSRWADENAKLQILISKYGKSTVVVTQHVCRWCVRVLFKFFAGGAEMQKPSDTCWPRDLRFVLVECFAGLCDFYRRVKFTQRTVVQ